MSEVLAAFILWLPLMMIYMKLDEISNTLKGFEEDKSDEGDGK